MDVTFDFGSSPTTRKGAPDAPPLFIALVALVACGQGTITAPSPFVKLDVPEGA